MPSLIYIARITRSDEELAEGLRVAGFQVKSFAPGEITADECLLVMTPEAVLAGVPCTNSVAAVSHSAEASRKVKGAPPVPSDMRAYRGAHGSFWESLRPGGGNRLAANESITLRDGGIPVTPSPVTWSAIPSSGMKAQNLASIPIEAGPRKLHRSPLTSTGTLLRLPVVREAERANRGQRVSQLRPWLRPAAVLGGLLVLAIALLTNTASTFSSSTDAAAAQGDSNSTDSEQTPSEPLSSPRTPRFNSESTQSSAEGSKSWGGARRHLSDYDFVAEDFTNHLAVRSPRHAASQNPEFKRRAQGSVEPKRIVMN